MTAINDFIKIIVELIQFFDELIQTENEKLEAISKNNVFKLEDCMKKEQVSILKLKGLDKKRESIQSDLSFDNLSFREILSRLDISEKSKLNPLFRQLEEKVHFYNNISQSAKTAIEVNIHTIDKKISLLNQEKLDHIYSNNGAIINSNRKNFTNRKV